MFFFFQNDVSNFFMFTTLLIDTPFSYMGKPNDVSSQKSKSPNQIMCILVKIHRENSMEWVVFVSYLVHPTFLVLCSAKNFQKFLLDENSISEMAINIYHGFSCKS